MPAFDTPEPIAATVVVAGARVQVKRCKAFAASEGGRSPQIQSTSVALGTA